MGIRIARSSRTSRETGAERTSAQSATVAVPRFASTLRPASTVTAILVIGNIGNLFFLVKITILIKLHSSFKLHYRLVDNTTCKDVDECEIPGSCSQICRNDEGSYKCECEPGYMRDPRNMRKCKAMEGHASLLFARRRDIRKISLDHHEMTSIVNETNSATALDFVFRTGMIFWSDVTDKKIYKAPIDEGNDRTVVVSDDITTSDGLAVDWIYNHIYWTDTGKNTIELANFEGKMRKVLIRDNLEEPRAIALNPMDGWMFWTDWGSDAKIERAGMDGSHRQAIVTYEVKWPNGLTLDLVKKRVYWVDAKLNSISSCNYNGGERRLVLSNTEYLKHPFSITTFEDWLYWTDWDKSAVYRANKFTGADVKAVTATEMVRKLVVAGCQVCNNKKQTRSSTFSW